MAYQALGIGTAPNDGTGDNLRTGGDKINDNFSEIYTLLGTGTALSSGISATATVISLAGPTITGVASFADGSASAPSITNTGDSNTGIFFGSADQVDISTGGTARVTVSTTAVTSTVGIVIPDAGNIGSASDTDAIAISSAGVVALSATTEASATGTAALTLAGGLGVAKDVWIGDDLTLDSDAAVLSFGDDQDVTLTHVADTGILLNSTMVIQFNDASQNIGAPSATVLDINATDEVELNATLVDINANLDVSGTYTGGGLMTVGGNIVIPNDGDLGSVGATDALQISSTGIVTLKDDLLLKDACTIGTATTAGAISIAADGTVDLATAGATVNSTLISTTGLQTAWIPACAMRPTVSAGCAAITDVETTADRPDMQVLDFDASTEEHAQFQIAFPKSWNASTITYRVFWTSTATDTDAVVWTLEGVSVGDDATIDVAYGTGVAVTDNNISAAEDCLVSATSGNVTIAGAADDKITYFRIWRDADNGSDTMAEDARLIGVQIFFTTTAANDA